MTWLISVIVAIVRALLPGVADAAKPTCEDSSRQPVLRDKLRNRIRSRWGGGAALAVFCMVAFLPGCGGGAPFTRTIYVPAGEPVRLREDIDRAKVWVLDASGKPVPGRVTLREGWYALDMPENPPDDD